MNAVDTNILIDVNDSRDPGKQEIAASFARSRVILGIASETDEQRAGVWIKIEKVTAHFLHA